MPPSHAKTTSRTTIKDVARKAGVSISTVSRVINQSAPVTPELKSRVKTVIEELGYRPQTAARALASQRTNTIGLLLPQVSGDFIADMLRGIERGIIEGGFDLLVHSTRLGSKSDSHFKRVLDEKNTDGLIVFSDSLDDKELRRLHSIDFPVVLLHRSSPTGLNIPCVTVENKKGAYKLVDHLITVHGCQRIVYLRGPEGHEDSYWREIGYRQGLEHNHLPYDSDLIGKGEFENKYAYEEINHFLENGITFDAVFAGDDEAASGVVKALRDANLHVPEDIAVAGFDDARMASLFHPSLTTINAQVEQAGYATSRKLVRRIQTEDIENKTLLPTELVIRESCGCKWPR